MQVHAWHFYWDKVLQGGDWECRLWGQGAGEGSLCIMHECSKRRGKIWTERWWKISEDFWGVLVVLGETWILYRAGQKGSLAQLMQHTMGECCEPEFLGEAGKWRQGWRRVVNDTNRKQSWGVEAWLGNRQHNQSGGEYKSLPFPSAWDDSLLLACSLKKSSLAGVGEQQVSPRVLKQTVAL